jgi:DMSO/TMAO reductase YedYZ molybdopterin-dependent catalytic subunit
VQPARLRGGLAGAVSAGLGLGASELVAGLSVAFPSLIEALGNFVVDTAPPTLKDFAIEVFGTADKLVLLISIAVVTVLIGALVGAFAHRRFSIALIVFGGFAVGAAAAAARDPQVELGLALVPAGAAALIGLGALQALYRIDEPEPAAAGADGSRRTFLTAAGAGLAVALLAGGLGRVLIEQAKRMVAGREDVVLPSAAVALHPAPPGADLEVPGLTPIFVPNEDFYRIDTALSVPRVNLQDWTLTVNGRVDRPYTIDFSALLDMRMVERDITLACVSNPVGGGLVGNARWQGVPLREILDRAGVRDDAEQIVGRSVDRFTVGFPVAAAYDGREALVAVGMNGEPLPFEHGFPARLVVAGLYGYVSATKWLTEIELTGWDEFDAYWVPQGWAKEAPIKTQSRIDTPRRAERITPGPRTVAGVAWAPTRGISKVEVQLGEGAPWAETTLSEPLSENAWVQWQIDWDPEPGEHLLRVRATDGDGALQDEAMRSPAPDGATGWHTTPVIVREA